MSIIKKHSIVIAGLKTSISLEDEFWNGLRKIAGDSAKDIGELVAEIDAQKRGNLSSAIRLFVFGHYRDAAPMTSAANGKPQPAARA